MRRKSIVDRIEGIKKHLFANSHIDMSYGLNSEEYDFNLQDLIEELMGEGYKTDVEKKKEDEEVQDKYDGVTTFDKEESKIYADGEAEIKKKAQKNIKVK